MAEMVSPACWREHVEASERQIGGRLGSGGEEQREGERGWVNAAIDWIDTVGWVYCLEQSNGVSVTVSVTRCVIGAEPNRAMGRQPLEPESMEEEDLKDTEGSTLEKGLIGTMQERQALEMELLRVELLDGAIDGGAVVVSAGSRSSQEGSKHLSIEDKQRVGYGERHSQGCHRVGVSMDASKNGAEAAIGCWCAAAIGGGYVETVLKAQPKEATSKKANNTGRKSGS
eukprot:jgi/Psemu1/13202/gm1.13202_g